jgi:hypothetical protein
MSYEEFLRMDQTFAINSHLDNNHKMCVLQGAILHRSQKHDARILLNSGSDRQYISQSFVTKIELKMNVSREGED